jgi:phosphoglycerate dehydrogenase-like enzyme
MHEMKIARGVLAIGRAGAGTNNIPVAEMSKRGVPVFNAPGANANAVKELVLAALLLAARNLIPAVNYVASLHTDAPDLEKQVENGKKQFAGVELPNRTLGIVGLGAIGSMVADAAIKLGMKVIVDERAVVDALKCGRLKSYLCDFPSPALIGAAGVVALPHLGASTEEAEENCAAMVVDQIREYLEHGTIANSVNFPNVDMPRESPHRISIANTNVPNMLGQISTAMAASGLNIHNMVNKSRGDMAYTLVDVDSPIPEAAIAAVSAIDGVLAVRAIPARDAP